MTPTRDEMLTAIRDIIDDLRTEQIKMIYYLVLGYAKREKEKTA